MNLTRREKHFLIAAGILLVVLAFIPQDFVNAHEGLFIIFIVGPLGFYLATDWERINQIK